jgi:hypothetical protein
MAGIACIAQQMSLSAIVQQLVARLPVFSRLGKHFLMIVLR